MGKRGHVVAMLVMGLAMAGCSGSDGPGAAPESSTATTDTAVGGASGSNDATSEANAPTQDEALARLQRFEAQADCLSELGFTSVADSGGVTTQMAKGQDEAFLAASLRCQQEVDAQLGPDPAAAVLTEEQIGEEYDALLEVRDCLTDAGYPVTDPPSRQTWVASYVLVQDAVQNAQPGDNRQMDLPWNPYEEAQSVEAMEQCPAP